MELLLLILGIGAIAAFVGGGSTDSNLSVGGLEEVNEGTDGPDDLTGTPFDDIIYGRGGNDTLTGGIGNDSLDGNAGDDEVYGDEGEDSLFGGDGNDTLGGGTGDDFLRGGPGFDELRGGADDDLLEGALNGDFLQGDGGGDTLRGGPGADYLIGNLGADSLEGGPGDDTLIGLVGDYADAPSSDPDGPDALEGWGGSDLIVMGAGDHAWGEFATTLADDAGDTFVSGIWALGDPPTVHDYDGVDDELVLYHDPGLAPSPTVTVTEDTGPGGTVWQVGLDGDVLMLVDVETSGIVVLAEDIVVVPAPAPGV